MDREELEKQHGQVWTTEEATADFTFESFAAPMAFVKRNSDGKKGTLMFQHMPRFYFDFRERS